MRDHPLRPTLVLVLACVLAGLLFFMGIAYANTPFWGRFLLPIVVVFLWGRRRDIYLVTVLASVLVFITYWLNDTKTFETLLVNHLLPIVVLWAAAWLLAQRRQLQDELEDQRRQLLDQQQKLAAEVAARTAELGASERRYRLLAENAGDLIWTVDMDGNFTYVSASAQRVRGVTREEELRSSWFDRMPPATAAGAAAAIQADLAALRAGQPIDETPHPAPAYRKDGTLMWSETVMSPIYDEDGKPLGLCGTTRDITARHQAEEALRQSQEQLAKIYRSNPGGIAILRQSNSCFLEANDAFLAILGYTSEEIIGRSAVELGIMTPEMRVPLMASVLGEGYVRGMDMQIVGAHGQVVDVYFSIELVDFAGEPCFLLLLVDITARKHLEQQLQALNDDLEQRITARTADLESALADLQRANRLKDEFMAMISHELRTPLSNALAMAQVLAEQVAGPLNERQCFYVDSIMASGERLLYIINGILSYTHLISGKFVPQPVPCELASLLAICASSQEYKAVAKCQAIAVQVEPANLTIAGDPVAIAEVLKRLLDNAIKFTPEDGRIGLEARCGSVPGTVDLVVWDTGIGLDPAQLDDILQPFTQADARLARGYEGLGLGLAYVDQMVRLLGGTLSVAGQPSQGSRFTITLPAN